MTIENDRSGTMTTSAGVRSGPNGPSGEGDKVETAKAESAEVVDTATQAGKEVMSEISEQTTAVARTAKEQFGQLATQTRQELKAQSEQRGEQLAARLQTWAGQMKALVEGRVDEAGELRGLVGDAQQRLESYASSLRERGPDGVMQDVQVCSCSPPERRGSRSAGSSSQVACRVPRTKARRSPCSPTGLGGRRRDGWQHHPQRSSHRAAPRRKVARRVVVRVDVGSRAPVPPRGAARQDRSARRGEAGRQGCRNVGRGRLERMAGAR